LEESIRNEILSTEPTPENKARGTADPVFWDVYGLGKRANLRGLIFPEYNIVKELPKEFKQRGYGLDFGFVNDVTALGYFGLVDGQLWADELVYETGLVNVRILGSNGGMILPSIEDRLRGHKVSRELKIAADSAEKKSIMELRAIGFNVVATPKPKGSVKQGLDIMRRYKLNVTERSVNAIKELKNYRWKEDNTGSLTNEPIDTFNHFIDAWRYWSWIHVKQLTGIMTTNKKHYEHAD